MFSIVIGQLPASRAGADFGYGVTVEGIENQERLEVSAALGAQYGQGFLFARPMPPDEVIEWVKTFELGSTVSAITTPPGALTYHWSRMRGDGAQHPPRDKCPLTGFFASADTQAAALHDRLHNDSARAAESATLLTSWLMEEVSARY